MRVAMYIQLTFKQSYLLAYDPEGTVQNNLQVIFLVFIIFIVIFLFPFIFCYNIGE